MYTFDLSWKYIIISIFIHNCYCLIQTKNRPSDLFIYSSIKGNNAKEQTSSFTIQFEKLVNHFLVYSFSIDPCHGRN